MALDLILGKTRRNWARETIPSPAASDEVTLKMTEAEAAMVTDLATTKMRADAGDRAARKKLAISMKKIAKLRKLARTDKAARRALLVLRESGVLRGPALTFAMGAEIPNATYRRAVFSQALRAAGGRRPSTIDVFRAKAAVDGVMRKAGISLYLPGAGRGRITA